MYMSMLSPRCTCRLHRPALRTPPGWFHDHYIPRHRRTGILPSPVEIISSFIAVRQDTNVSYLLAYHSKYPGKSCIQGVAQWELPRIHVVGLIVLDVCRPFHCALTQPYLETGKKSLLPFPDLLDTLARFVRSHSTVSSYNHHSFC